MKIKHAIGITVNGDEVRAAFLSLVRGKARIKALESTKLDVPLEQITIDEKKVAESINDLENAFDINEPAMAEPEAQPDKKGHENEQNVSKIYALLERFQNLKANIAINAPHLTVKYEFIEKEQAPSKKQRLKEKIDIWGSEVEAEDRGSKYIDASDGKVLLVDYEYHPAIIDLMEEVNQFRAGNLNMVLMDTNELALIDLVKEIYKFEKEELTAIVYIEQDFSRVIFLKGSDIYHITPILHKGSMSEDVLELLYSRIIFAQDHYFIPEINKILVAGHSSRLKAKYYFRQKFPSAVTGYLNSKKIESDLRFKDRGLLFSRYAVPIALAWKALLKNAVKSKAKNFLPDYILERQAMPKLALHGYAMLLILVSTVGYFTWTLVSKNLEIRKVTSRINVMQQQIENNKALTDRVHAYDGQIMDIERKIAVVDSFSKGFDEMTTFLQQLNKSIGSTGELWVTELRMSGPKVNIVGIAKQRDKIPILANAIGGANLRKVTRSKYRGTEVFTFQLEKKLDEDSSKKNLTIFSFLKGKNGHADIAPAGDNRLLNQLRSAGAGKTNGASEDATNGKAGIKVYGFRVGIYDSRSDAMLAGKTYGGQGYPVNISETTENGSAKYVLIVGAFANLEEARSQTNILPLQSGIKSKLVRFTKHER